MLVTEGMLTRQYQEGQVQVAKGIKMFGDGIVETLTKEVRAAAFMGIVGGIIGVGEKLLGKNNDVYKVIKDSVELGIMYAWITVGSDHNEIAGKTHQPKVRMSDSLLSWYIGYRAYKSWRPFDNKNYLTRLLLVQPVNSKSLSGAREAISGWTKMALA